MTPQRIVKSFVKSREIISRQSLSNSNGKYNDYRSSSSTTLSAPLEQPTAGTSPTEAELLDPLVALQRRLLSNPGLTDMARLDILSLTCSQPQQDGSLIEINSSALEMLSNMMTKSIKQRAKARVLFNRIEASNNTTMEIEMMLIPQLRKYLEVSRSEAWDVIGCLTEMATKAIRRPDNANSELGAVSERSKVDWDSVVEALTRLQYE
ncbi:hypothetical protein BGZ97_013019 [Linnemannia gamsii]|uniref:Uncharacterized protein n=1 Tax=Linnemannia gamsii TaxID=64522 RepID=A0A9P6UL42_9FUNG|nr:hypothetical protein BGZ97_013019 [Linnemannia gamsii]